MRVAEYINGKVVFRDASANEELSIRQAEMQAAGMPPPEPTTEERIAALEGLTDDIVLFMAELIGG